MPELPEVETIRRQLEPVVVGRQIESFEVLDSRLVVPLSPEEFVAAVSGRTVERLERRGKYLVWQLSGLYLLLHLRMTGALLYNADTIAHLRAVIRLESGDGIFFVDPRRFGTAQLVNGREALDAFFAQRLGVEPLEEQFISSHLVDLLGGRKTPVKAALLDQKKIAGIGNIYADEALFRAKIHPLRQAGKLRRREIERLHAAIIAALEVGIEARGASIDDFRHVDGARGSFQNEFLVHRREGEDCPNCGGTIIKFRAAGRGTYACERCQQRPK